MPRAQVAPKETLVIDGSMEVHLKTTEFSLHVTSNQITSLTAFSHIDTKVKLQEATFDITAIFDGEIPQLALLEEATEVRITFPYTDQVMKAKIAEYKIDHATNALSTITMRCVSIGAPTPLNAVPNPGPWARAEQLPEDNLNLDQELGIDVK